MWQLTGTIATWNSPPLNWEVDLCRPDGGLGAVTVAGEFLFWPGEGLLRVLANTNPGEDENLGRLDDAYVRQNDLIALYDQRVDQPMRPQIYWRGIPASEKNHLGGCELIVSAQTNLLNADQSLAVRSNVPAVDILKLQDGTVPSFEALTLSPGGTEALSFLSQIELRFECGPGAFLFRTGHDWSYLEMVYPSDFAQASLFDATHRRPTSWCLTSSLFPESLEKGVIRRGRIRGLFLSRSGDEAAALAAYREFVASPLPLTT